MSYAGHGPQSPSQDWTREGTVLPETLHTSHLSYSPRRLHKVTVTVPAQKQRTGEVKRQCHNSPPERKRHQHSGSATGALFCGNTGHRVASAGRHVSAFPVELSLDLIDVRSSATLWATGPRRPTASAPGRVLIALFMPTGPPLFPPKPCAPPFVTCVLLSRTFFPTHLHHLADSCPSFRTSSRKPLCHHRPGQGPMSTAEFSARAPWSFWVRYVVGVPSIVCIAGSQ